MKPVVFSVAAVCLALQLTVSGVGPSFRPDATFKGSTLNGWHAIGAAQWRMENGEIIGSPKQPGGGWLVLDRSLQDVGFYASFRCAPGCTTGVLLRAEKTATGMKGIYVSLTSGEVEPYRVTLDAQGQFLTRDALRPGGGQMRVAPPPDPNPFAPAAPAPARGAVPSVALPLTPPDTSLKAGEWNDRDPDRREHHPYLLNNAAERGRADHDAGRYGPMALYVGGTGEVRFKDIAFKDLALKTVPKRRCPAVSACSVSAISITAGAPARTTSTTTACSTSSRARTSTSAPITAAAARSTWR